MRKYDELEMEVVLFTTEDVISDSITNPGQSGGNSKENENLGEWLP